MQTQLLGQPVKHISFGKGIITDISDKKVTIHFSQGKKKFLYPQAFSDFLILKDMEKQNEINKEYNKILREEIAAQKKESKKLERLRQIKTMKINPNSQAAFNISSNEVKEIVKRGAISTGCYLSGYSKGEPRIPNRINPNSVCLLTALPESREEIDRRILGVFMARDDFWGERCRNGVINGHGKYRIILPADIRLSYWNYFEDSEMLSRWGKVPFKYFANRKMQRILRDMIDLLVDTEQEINIKEFYQYFCKINRLSIDN